MGEGNDVWEFPVLRVLEEEIKKKRLHYFTAILVLGDAVMLSSFCCVDFSCHSLVCVL